MLHWLAQQLCPYLSEATPSQGDRVGEERHDPGDQWQEVVSESYLVKVALKLRLEVVKKPLDQKGAVTE
jgi:hypothetical protein